MTPVASIKNLNVTYHTGPALSDVTLDIPGPTLAAVIGPNGAGKSTLLKAMLGLVPADNGTVFFFGGRTLAQARGDIAYIPQRSAVDWHFPATVRDVVRMGMYAQAGWFRRLSAAQNERAESALHEVGLDALADRQIGQLSGGQQQRVFLARALAQDANLYLMDEPLAGVDVASEQAILATLRHLRERGKTVVCVHHDLQTVGAAFDHVILLNRHLIAQGPPQSVMNKGILGAAYGIPDFV